MNIERIVELYNRYEKDILYLTVGLFMLAKCFEGLTLLVNWLAG